QQKLAEYQTQLDWTLSKHRDPNGGRDEKNGIENLEVYCRDLDRAISSPEASMIVLGEGVRLAEQKKVRSAIAQVVQATEDLHRAIDSDLRTRSDVAKRHYQLSLIIVVATS